MAEAPRPQRGDHLYAIGGFHGQILSTVETFEPHMNAWVMLAPMELVRNPDPNPNPNPDPDPALTLTLTLDPAP